MQVLKHCLMFLTPLCQNLPHLRFNKEGNLLAVTTSDAGFKVLSNSEGIKYFRSHQTLKVALGTKVHFSHYLLILY